MNRLNRKIFSSAVCILSLAAFISCGKGKSGEVVENNKEIHIRVWESKNGIDSFLKEAAKKYHEQHPEIFIDYINVEIHNTVDALAVDGPNGIGADIIAAPHDNLGTLVSKKLILPTENPDAIKKQILGACSKALTYNGTMYGYPASAETYALFYNKKLIRENEVPKSWTDLVTWVQNFNKEHPGQKGFVMDVTNAYYSILFATANDNRLYGESGTDGSHPNMNTVSAKNGMKFFQSLNKALGLNNVELSTSACDGMFASGNAAMHITGLWNVNSFEKSGLDFGVATLPSLPGESKPASSFSGTRGMFVSAFSKHPKEAADFAAFLISPEMQKLRFEYTGAMPAINTTVSSKYMSGFLQQLEYAFPMPSIPAMGKFWTETSQTLKNIWNGGDVEFELNNLDSKIRG